MGISIVLRHIHPRVSVTFFVVSTASLLLAYFAFLSTYVSPAQALTTVPTTMNFQGRLADSTGTIMPDGLYNMQFSLYTVSSGGSTVWTETRENNGTDYRVQVTNGLFSTKLGEANPLSASLFASGSLYFEITMATPATATCSTNGCASWESPMTPRHQMSTSAYAYNAETLDGYDSADFAAASGSANYIQNGTSPQTADFNITGTGTAATLQAATFDRASTGTLTIGGTNATAITLADSTTVNANLTVSASNSLTLVGGNTASRPASPAEGMVYFDSESDQLLTYANGKWQADKTDAVLVAASNSSQADKDAADYIADGTADQTEINAALTAGAGKKVVLLAGTYTINAGISVPNSTMLAGIGNGSIITVPNSLNPSFDVIANTDTTTGTGVIIRDLTIDGNKTNQTGGFVRGIYFNGMGDATTNRPGGTIDNLLIRNFYYGDGVHLTNSDSNLITNVTSSDHNTNTNTNGFYMETSNDNIITGNVSRSNSNEGFGIFGNNNSITNNTAVDHEWAAGFDISGTNVTFTGNKSSMNGSGFILDGDQLIATDNIAADNIGAGFVVFTDNSTISDNGAANNGGATANNGMYLSAADNNTLTGNAITDTSCTATCYAINITSTANNNYLANNVFSDTDATYTATINDAATDTIYAGQSMSPGGQDIRFKQPASSAAFSVQDANGADVLNINTTDGTLQLGDYNGGTNSVAGGLTIANTTNANTVTLISADQTNGSYTLSIPDLTANDTLCTVGLGCGGANTSLSNLSSTNINTALNATNNDLTLQTTTSGDVNIAPAGVINLQGDTVLAAGSTLTITGDTYTNIAAIGSPTEGMTTYDTSNNQLLVYSGGKWKADSADAILVAASDSSQADKNAADYVADGNTAAAADGDQVQINQALTAAAGKKVVLLAGTYTVDASISVPNNTTLSGVGAGTIVTIPDSLDTTMGLITNTDTSTGTGVAVRDLTIDGNKANQNVGYMTGIDLNHVGDIATNRPGATVENLVAVNLTSPGIRLSNSNNNIITSNTVDGVSYGIYIDRSDKNSITNNIVNDSVYGIDLYLSDGNTITDNILSDNGSTTDNNAIYLHGADSNAITNNTITDTQCDTTCYAINVADSGSNNNYLSNNVFSDTDADDDSSIQDIGTGTVYAGQSTTAGGLDISYKQAASTTAFSVQDVSGSAIFTVDTSNGIIEVGPANQSIAFESGATDHNIEIGRIDGTASTPYIDFHSGATAVSHDARIIVSGGNGTLDGGNLTIQAAEVDMQNDLFVNGDAYAANEKIWLRDESIGAAGLEIGGRAGTTTTNYIDFHTDGSSGTDYNSRIRASTGSNSLLLISNGGQTCTLAGSWSCTSDATLKNVTGSVKNSLSGIMQLQPVYFEWKNDPSRETQMGLIAQDVQGQFPELVTTNEDGRLSLNYQGLVAPVIGAIQEQQAQIASLETTVALLQGGPLANGGVVNGNLRVAGNTTLEKSLTVKGATTLANLTSTGSTQLKTLTVTTAAKVQGVLTVTGATNVADIYVNGHIVSRGNTPTAIVGEALGTDGSEVTIDGTDGAGTIEMTAGVNDTTTGVLAHITFDTAYTDEYKVVISPSDANSADLRMYVVKTDDGFDIVSSDAAVVQAAYTIDYIVQGVKVTN